MLYTCKFNSNFPNELATLILKGEGYLVRDIIIIIITVNLYIARFNEAPQTW